MTDSYRNTANGYARVGMQIGRIGGDVTVHDVSAGDQAVPGDLSAMLVALREELRASRDRSTIDEESADAVERRLDEAADCLPLDDRRSKNGFLAAMKGAVGLVDGVAGLGTTIAELINAAQGVQ